jgi:D-alanyl-D-alanine carboxypeptidase
LATLHLNSSLHTLPTHPFERADRSLQTPVLAAFFRRLFVVFAAALAISGCTSMELDAPQPARMATPRYAAIVVDGNSGRMLYQANAESTRHPASLTKMMTLYLLFEALESGRIGLTTPIPVSDFARGRPPTKIGFKSGETIDAESAIRALATKSANDVAVAVAEYLGGSEANFARAMTAKAGQLGMRSTVFRNASGLPDEGQRTSARDMAVLGMALRKRFPQYFHYFGARDFTYRGKLIRGHNDLIGRVRGVDGIKTGYIRASGYNIVTSVSAGGRRLIVVVMGADSARSRNDHVEELIARYLPRTGS